MPSPRERFPRMGSTQRFLVQRAVRDGVVIAATRTHKNSALHAHDRGLLVRGETSSHYHPSDLAKEAFPDERR